MMICAFCQKLFPNLEEWRAHFQAEHQPHLDLSDKFDLIED